MGLYKPPLMLYKDRTAKNSDRVKVKFPWMWSRVFCFFFSTPVLSPKQKISTLFRSCEASPELRNGCWGIAIRHRIRSLTQPYFLYETEKICASWSSSVLIPKMSVAFVFNKSSFTFHTENGVVLHSGVFYRA